MVQGRLTQFAEIEGLKELQKKISPPSELLVAPWKEAMANLVEAGVKSGRVGGPRRSGLLISKIYGGIQKKPMPMWGAVRSRAKRKSRAYPRGYSYPRLLNYATKWGHRGWFDRAVIEPTMRLAGNVLEAAARAIGQRWER